MRLMGTYGQGRVPYPTLLDWTRRVRRLRKLSSRRAVVARVAKGSVSNCFPGWRGLDLNLVYRDSRNDWKCLTRDACLICRVIC